MGCARSVSDRIPARHVLCFMLFLGFMVTFLLRVNINLAVVAMVNSTDEIPDDFLIENASQHCIQRSHLHNSHPDFSHNLSLQSISEDAQAPLADEVVGEFEWSEFQQSIILSSFFWGYLFFQIPGGRIAEVWGTKSVFGSSILINGILSLALPLAARLHWSLLLLIRALQGLAQGVVFPCLTASVPRWVPVEERASFISFAIQGCSLGQVIALPLCGWILTTMGWPAVFYISGVLAIAWYIAWSILIYDSPDEHPRISIQEKRFLDTHLEKKLPEGAPPVPWLSVLTSLQFWVGVVAAVGNDWGFHTFCNFGPKYMKSALGFDLEQSSWLSSLPFLSQYIFAIAYGAFCDRLLKCNVQLIRVRKMSVIVSHVLPAIGMLALSFTGCDVALSVVILTFSVSAIGALSCGFFQNPLDIAPNYAGSLTGVTNAIGAVTAVISTPLAGAILQTSGSPAGWRIIFCITALVYTLTSLPYLMFAQAKLEPWSDTKNIRTRKKTFSLRQVASDDCEPAETEILTPSKKSNRY